jgi:hypothetical protein
MTKEHLSWTEAVDEERRVVNQRRPLIRPVRDDLVGLAFSGGGIRSATFGLGVLEAGAGDTRSFTLAARSPMVLFIFNEIALG